MERSLIIEREAQKHNKTYKKLRDFLLYCNKYVDECNIGDNGFNTVDEIDKWWSNKDDSFIVKVFDEYEGIENLHLYFD